MRQLYTEITGINNYGTNYAAGNNNKINFKPPSNAAVSVQKLANNPKISKATVAQVKFSNKEAAHNFADKLNESLGVQIVAVKTKDNSDTAYAIIDLAKATENFDVIQKNLENKGIPVNNLTNLFNGI